MQSATLTCARAEPATQRCDLILGFGAEMMLLVRGALDLRVDLGLVVVTTGERRVNVREGKARVLSMDLLSRRPPRPRRFR